MYAYLQGKLTYKSPTTLYVDVNGVGYLVHITLHTYAKIEKTDETRLFTYLHVKEDILSLYGFAEEDERDLFISLLSVSGIGPNTARIVLSSMTPLEAKTAIVTENDLAFKKVKGVGPKTAKRIILDLKDKVKGETNVTGNVQAAGTVRDWEEATHALVALGFQKQKVQKVLATIADPGNKTLEELIKEALQKLT